MIPHMNFPVSFTAAGGVAVNEQDSLEDVTACVAAVVVCPVGARGDLPAFGIPSLLGRQAPVNTAALMQSVSRWEPRASTTAVEYPDAISDAIRHVQMTVSTVQPA